MGLFNLKPSQWLRKGTLHNSWKPSECAADVGLRRFAASGVFEAPFPYVT